MDLRAAATGPLATRLSLAYMEEHALLPLGEGEEGEILVAAGRPLDADVLDELQLHFGRAVRVVPVPEAELQAALLSARPLVPAAPTGDDDAALALGDLEALANQPPVVQFVNVVLLDALRAGASDLHVEAIPEGLRVRQRLDGVLHDVTTLARPYQSGVISRIKLLGGLDIGERRLPQDGRARVRLADREVDLRVSTVPTLHGESVVVRLLDHGATARSLGDLGMPERLRARFQRLVSRPSGLVLVTGPTGSGKTTTLYAALMLLNHPGVKILTVEDPVEYQLQGVTQIPVNRKAGLNFANALRSMLRHDPDVMMIGEMRDRETAEIAVQAALTGHLVLSTLHTNDAPSGVTRLVDMGIEPYLVAATVQGILAQRLVRQLCRECAEPYTPGSDELALAPPRLLANQPRFLRPRGCSSCSGTGYRGRSGVFELFVPSEEARAAIGRGLPLGELRAQARKEGLVPLGEAAWTLAAEGRTSVAEVLRVTNEENW